ncbi:GspE/PulE family protein [Malaciobacter mytili]|uniref:Transformation system protein n=1 Tax=Malaciobacter mytili LMG 24559 TaxID=1032238 RepID=A0AAX2AHP9_9BACT|nr:GspE/PulE family protein [Malaciobacter mytili]AXH15654.1 type II secretion/transformation system, E protein [Malaciobacter mytili LMG 24559]RXK16160.1 transformation system protein [Malaciobacter mytili LMG 24559]
MNKEFYELIIDYNFVKKYDVKALEKALILPFFEDEIYTSCAVCKKSDIKFAKTCFFNITKFLEFKSEEILFYLSDIEKRIALYNLSLEVVKTNSTQECIEEFLTLLLDFSIEKRASDIHFETHNDYLCIKFRIDGKLKHIINFHKNFYKVISSIIKLKASLDITQYKLALDGRFSKSIQNSIYDFRVSILPTLYGESIVLRILDNKTIDKKLNALEFSSNIFKSLEEISSLTQGLVLVCGPTGSGKTTTLYSLLKSLDYKNKKIITVEEPVEYKIKNICQINIDKKRGLSFNSVLKNILRQDPDIIFIGEIRDSLSLQIAIQASLTGHLVLSTIHSSNALNAISRLLDLKCQNFLLSSTLKYIFYQRLVLKVCPFCNFKGCYKCNYTKYLGRTVIAEVIKIDEVLSSLISKNETFDSFKTYLNTIKFKNILDDAKEKVKKSLTTLDEVYKVLGFEDEV